MVRTTSDLVPQPRHRNTPITQLRRHLLHFPARPLDSMPIQTSVKTCHQNVWDKHFANKPHSALLKGGQHGCQSCHGPGQAHVDGGDITKIVRFETLSQTETAAICTKCHQSSLETQIFSKSEHLANGVSCISCHSPHKSNDVNFMLVKSQTELY
jgi:predicted CXXCH cytochrome family protein